MALSMFTSNMRVLSTLLLLHLCCLPNASSQTVFWTDNFTNGCASNCLASTYGGWSVVDNVDGTSGGASNNWFVSCAEEGVTPPGCATVCVGDASLHIGLNPGAGGDQGASFNETGASNATFKLVVSPTISTVGYTNITLHFDFMAYGSSACSEDRAQLRLSADGGATWPAGDQYCLNTVCCGVCNGYTPGQWALYTLALPAAFENNPNVRVAFHWRNNGNGAGTDPSVAIDDIRLSVPALPLNLIDFAARTEHKKVKLTWTSTDESNVSHFEVERSGEGKTFKNIGQVKAKGNNQPGPAYYTFEDALMGAPTTYYRLKMVDKDGSFQYSPIVSVTNAAANQATLAFANLASNEEVLKLRFTTPSSLNASVALYDLQGKKVIGLQNKNYAKGQHDITLDVSKLKSSVYIVQVKSDDHAVDISKKFFKME